MTNYRRNFTAGGSFFFTVNLEERRLRLLTEHIDELRSAFRETRRHHPFTIDAMVVLPDHLHAVWTMPEDDADFATRWRLIKSAFWRTAVRSRGKVMGIAALNPSYGLSSGWPKARLVGLRRLPYRVVDQGLAQ
jgi:REP element-mobilizing transposase RayT